MAGEVHKQKQRLMHEPCSGIAASHPSSPAQNVPFLAIATPPSPPSPVPLPSPFPPHLVAPPSTGSIRRVASLQ